MEFIKQSAEEDAATPMSGCQRPSVRANHDSLDEGSDEYV